MAALSDQDDPLASSKPLATGYAMPDYLTGPAPVKPQTTPAAPAAPTEKTQDGRALTPVRPQIAAPAQKSAVAPQAHAAAGDATSMIAHFEGFREAPYWDVNHYRVGYGSDTITHADGRVEPVTAFTRVTQEDAQRDLQRRVGIYQNTIQRTVGPEAWARLSPQAQASITSVAYNYGHVPAPVLAAAQSGDPQKIAASIAGLAGANDGVNAKRRQQEAGAVLGTFGLSGPVAAHGAAQNYAMPAGTEGAPYQPQIGQPDAPQAAAPEQKKFDWDSIAKGPEKKFDWDSIAVADGAKKVNEEVGAEGKGFLGRTYDKLMGGADVAARAIGSSVPFNDRLVAAEKTYLPNAIGGNDKSYSENLDAERAANEQATREHPFAMGTGMALGGLATGLGVERAGAEALSAAANPISQGFKTGLAGGSVLGLSNAPDWTKPGDTLAHEALGAGAGATLGVLPGVASEGARYGGKVLDHFGLASSGEAGEAQRALRGTLAGRTQEAAEQHGAEAEALKTQEAGKAAEAAKHEAELARIEKARDELSQRDTKRATRDTAGVEDPKNPKSHTAIREAVAEETRKSVRETEKAAREAGMGVEEAKAFSLRKEGERLEAEQAAADIAERHAARPGRSDVELGKDIQKTANEIYERRVAQRSQESGLGSVLKEQGQRPVSTAALVKYIDEAMPNLANSGAESTLNWIRSKALTRSTETVGEGEAAKQVEKVAESIPLEKAESLRKSISTALRTKQMAVDNNQTADASEAAHHLRQLYRDLRGAAGEASPDYKTAMRKFVELSRPLDLFERKGALAATTKADPLSQEYNMLAGNVAANVLNKTKAGAPAIETLVKENPGLQDGLREYFNQASNGKLTEAFLEKNEQALRQSGLYDEFAGLVGEGDAAKAGVALAKGEEKAARAAEKPASAAERAVNDILANKAKLRDRAQSAKIDEPLVPTKDVGGAKHEANALDDSRRASSRPQAPEVAAEKAKADAQRLEGQAREAGKNAKTTQQEVADLAKNRQLAEAKKDSFERFSNVIQNQPLEDVIPEAEKFAKSMYQDKKYLNKQQYEDMLEEIQIAKRKTGDKENAEAEKARLLKFIGGSVLATGAAAAGLYLRNVPIH